MAINKDFKVKNGIDVAGNATIGGSITVTGAIGGRDIAADGTKLDTIETSATADQTKADIDALGIAATSVTGSQATAITANTAKVSNVDHPLVETAVPVGALFTDTDTVYTHPTNHAISVITGLQTALDAKTTESYVDTEITNLIGGAPGALDTLNELAEIISVLTNVKVKDIMNSKTVDGYSEKNTKVFSLKIFNFTI
jgi:hypothetical protein